MRTTVNFELGDYSAENELSTNKCSGMTASSSYFLQLFCVIWLCTLSVCTSDHRYSHGGARHRFEAKFNESCKKYSFVQKYIDMLERPHDKYTIFVYHEAGKSNGGLGDRLAGMLTAMAFSLRFNRTFLIEGDTSFENSFRPYSTNLNEKYSWKSWDWANWQREYSSSLVKLNCVNPHPKNTYCAMDADYWQDKKVIKFYGNRSYLCRWLIKPSLGLTAEVRRSLDIGLEADLYEVAGCMLRLAIWPSEKLWWALDESLRAQFQHRRSAHTSKQVGFHFRCGDSSMVPQAPGQPHKVNPECVFDPAVPWKGTSFMDDNSIDSPVDMAHCGREVLTAERDKLTHHPNHSAGAAGGGGAKHAHGTLAYIASDNKDSSDQINSTLNWAFTIKPPQGCHVDLQKSDMCTLSTSLDWFMLGLSDHIIMQGLIKPKVSMFDNSPETAHLAQFEQLAPISAFSRYAAIYSLGKDSIRYGKGCQSVNRTALAQQSHGNWVCDPKTFY